MEAIEWGQVIAAAVVVAGTALTGRWAWSKLPKKDMGASALATVQAAQAAVHLMDQVTDERMAQLEQRVTRLEEILEEKEGVIKRLEAEIKALLRWIQALIEQVTSLGQEPVTLKDIEWRNDGDEVG